MLRFGIVLEKSVYRTVYLDVVGAVIGSLVMQRKTWKLGKLAATINAESCTTALQSFIYMQKTSNIE